jgi:hypothetical protein
MESPRPSSSRWRPSFWTGIRIVLISSRASDSSASSSSSSSLPPLRADPRRPRDAAPARRSLANVTGQDGTAPPAARPTPPAPRTADPRRRTRTSPSRYRRCRGTRDAPRRRRQTRYPKVQARNSCTSFRWYSLFIYNGDKESIM